MLDRDQFFDCRRTRSAPLPPVTISGTQFALQGQIYLPSGRSKLPCPVRRSGTNSPMSQIAAKSVPNSPAQTGVAGLDEILGGGLIPHRLYLLEGVPGSGKTTLALQFLLEGVRCGEPVLYVTLSETEEELQEVARSHGLSMSGISI